MDNILSNGTYMLQPVLTTADFYDYAMYDADGNFTEGIKRGDGNYSYGFARYYTSAATSAAFQIVPKYVTLKEVNDRATSAIYMCSGCRFLERVEGHFNNMTIANNMFAGCSELQYLPDNSFNNVLSANNMFQGCSSLKEVPSNSFNGLINSNSANGMFTNTSALSSWGSNTFNSVTGIANMTLIPSAVTAMKNIDGWATSFENLRGFGHNLSKDQFSGFASVSSRLIPIIDHFKNKTVPMASNTAQMFKWFTNAADYQECVNSPTYSGWV